MYVMKSNNGHPGGDNNRDFVHPSESMDDNKPIGDLDDSMEVNEVERGPGHENVQSGRVHKGGRRLVCLIPT